jgi:hypothetical protein
MSVAAPRALHKLQRPDLSASAPKSRHEVLCSVVWFRSEYLSSKICIFATHVVLEELQNRDGICPMRLLKTS